MDFRSELSEAAQTGNTARMRELLDQNRDFAGVPDEAGYTPLHYAAYFGHTDAARYLIAVGADVAAISMDPLRNQPLHAAAGSGYTEITRILLDAGADVNAEQTGQWTALHGAAQKGHLDVVALLLERGARPEGRSSSGSTPLSLAREKGHEAVVTLLAPLTPES
jgi:ankyrin repeat protein